MTKTFGFAEFMITTTRTSDDVSLSFATSAALRKGTKAQLVDLCIESMPVNNSSSVPVHVHQESERPLVLLALRHITHVQQCLEVAKRPIPIHDGVV